MDVMFEISKTRQFTIEIGFFDTVLEMKEKIQKYEGFPVARQTLVFNGRVMADDRDTEYYEVLEGSRILLRVEPDSENPVKLEEPSRVQIIVRNSIAKRQFAMQIDVSETVSGLKDRIYELEGIPASRSALFFHGVEMQDHRTLAEHGVSDGEEVSVVIRPFPPAPAAGAAKRLRLMVLSKCGTKKVPVEVNASDNVSELRKELQRLHGHLQFHLPTEDYFFIYKQNVMDDDRTFRWHDVRQGDTIEIFIGSVTGGT